MASPYRSDFDMPGDVAYLNAASFSPLPIETCAIGRAAVSNKAQPWLLPADFANQQYELARASAARLIGVAADDVSLISSVGYGVATIAKGLELPRGSRVIVLEDDHASPVLEWHVRGEAQGFTVDTVRRPADLDWTAAVIEAIGRPGAPQVGAVSISSMHWSDGALLDMAAIADAARVCGAAFIIDATQTTGVIALNIAAIDPDALIFPTYKWLLGPYGRAFMYVAKRRQNGMPLEQTQHSRMNVRAENEVYFGDLAMAATARRFDMGERDHFISMAMATASIDYINRIGPVAVSAHLRPLIERLADGLAILPVRIAPPRCRAPHILGIEFLAGRPPDLMQRLARQNVFGAWRLGRLRLSPHIYNDTADIDRAITALRSTLG